MAHAAAGAALGKVAEVGTAVAGTGGFFLFGYNRDCYKFDTEMRFERFSTGREYACTQTEQYRGDVEQLSSLVTSRNMQYSTLATLCLALNVALYCAGRLGLHGPSPPSWIMGLWLTNNAASFSFQILTVFISMHAFGKAGSAGVMLRTRNVRVPVPSLKQLDAARKFCSEFEQADWQDIFRVPYLSNNGCPQTDAIAESPNVKLGGSRMRATSAPPKASSWIREEYQQDRNFSPDREIETEAAGTVSMAKGPPPNGELPEHFHLFGKAMKEWFVYDIYARVSLFLGWSQFLIAGCYYGLGHIFIELRAFWVAFADAFMLAVAVALILNFDIVTNRKGLVERSDKLNHFQWCAPLAVVPAAIGMALDFAVEYNPFSVTLCWIFIFISYVLNILYCARLFEIVLPDGYHGWSTTNKDRERTGDKWWPDSWCEKLPSAFIHVLYMVAPPKRLAPGQYDIVREVKESCGQDIDGTCRYAGVAPAGDVGLTPQPNYAPKGASASASAGSAMGGLTPGDIYPTIVRTDGLFKLLLDPQAYNDLSTQSQKQVVGLYDKFKAADKKTGMEQVKEIVDCLYGLEEIAKKEGIQVDTGDEAAYEADGGNDYEFEKERQPTSTGKGYKMKPTLFHQSHVQPSFMLAAVVLAMFLAWIWMVIGCIVDVAVGEQGLITSPHWSRPPMTRWSLEGHDIGTPLGFPWPASKRPYLPEQYAWDEEKRHMKPFSFTPIGGFGKSIGVAGRRLETADDTNFPLVQQPPVSRAAGLSTALEGLLASLPRGDPATASALRGVGLPAEAPEPVSWPGFFEPQLVACGPPVSGGGSHVATLTPRGVGAMARVGGPGSWGGVPAGNPAEAFKLAGLSHLPPLMGASWGSRDGDGLMLVSRAGHLVACPGARPSAGGTWACSPLAGAPRTLPLAEGSSLRAAAAAWLRGPGGIGGEPRLHAAMIDQHTPDVVAIFVHEGGEDEEAWLPFGEVQVPRRSVASPSTVKVSLAFADEGDLIVTTARGGLLRRRLSDGAVISSSPESLAQDSWQGTCGLHHGPGGLAHLHLQAGSSRARRPELLISSAGGGAGVIFQ